MGGDFESESNILPAKLIDSFLKCLDSVENGDFLISLFKNSAINRVKHTLLDHPSAIEMFREKRTGWHFLLSVGEIEHAFEIECDRLFPRILALNLNRKIECDTHR